MQKSSLNIVIRQSISFLLLFCIFYFGTKFWIGLASEGGYYSKFVHDYLDYISWLKLSYIKGIAFILSLMDIQTIEEPGFLIRISHGRGVIIAYDCVGYGVMSFWAAYVLSFKNHFKSNLLWLLSGLLILWGINFIRILLFLLAINKGWRMPLGIDHHTWFSIFAYIAIFILIWFKEKKKHNNQ